MSTFNGTDEELRVELARLQAEIRSRRARGMSVLAVPLPAVAPAPHICGIPILKSSQITYGDQLRSDGPITVFSGVLNPENGQAEVDVLLHAIKTATFPTEESFSMEDDLKRLVKCYEASKSVLRPLGVVHDKIWIIVTEVRDWCLSDAIHGREGGAPLKRYGESSPEKKLVSSRIGASVHRLSLERKLLLALKLTQSVRELVDAGCAIHDVDPSSIVVRP
jgi:hypothetical protein